MKSKLLRQFTVAVLALLVGGAALGAPQNADGVMVFAPLDVTDNAGVKVKQGVLTYQGQNYVVRLDGLSVGGILANGVTVTGEVYGLNNVNDLEDTYNTELAQSDAVSSQTLWLYSNRGIRIHLQTDNPDLSIASGGDKATVGFDHGE